MNVWTSFIIVYLAFLSVRDIRSKRILTIDLLFGIILTIAMLCFGPQVSLIDRIIGMLIGWSMIGLSIISRDAIGKGDTVLILYLGIIFGYIELIKILSLGFFIVGTFCIIGYSTRRYTRKHKVPFVPFLLLGVVSNLLLAV